MKGHLANYGIGDVLELRHQVRRTVKRLQRRPRLLRSFIRHTPLPLRL
jgi:hypothetical protein